MIDEDVVRIYTQYVLLYAEKLVSVLAADRDRSERGRARRWEGKRFEVGGQRPSPCPDRGLPVRIFCTRYVKFKFQQPARMLCARMAVGES